MPWDVEWSAAAVAGRGKLHWRVQAFLLAHVMRFAATEEGDVEPLPDVPHGLRLRVPGALAILLVAPTKRLIHVHVVLPG